jgi:hypothetical protein
MKTLVRILLALALMLVVKTGLASALPTNWYSTGASTGTENSAAIPIQPGGVVNLIAIVNDSTSLALTGMCFDATSLPGNGAVPRLPPVPLQAGSTSAGTPGSLALPRDGFQVINGLVCACSTTAKTLTVDTTSGGDCFFGVGWNQ